MNDCERPVRGAGIGDEAAGAGHPVCGGLRLQSGLPGGISRSPRTIRAIPAQKDRGFAACNWLALNRSIPERTRNLAISNLHFYVETAAKMMPSFTARQIGFEAPDGYRPMNPSIARQGDEFVLVQRTVNYTIDHAFPDGDDRRYTTPNGVPITTRNFLLRLDADLAIRSSTEILPPEGMPEPAWPLVQGFEDLRPFVWRDGLWCVACVRELTREGWCEQVLVRIDDRAAGALPARRLARAPSGRTAAARKELDAARRRRRLAIHLSLRSNQARGRSGANGR